MKTIQLKRMQVENFKGLPLFDIRFAAVTNIIGRNGVGKTSLHDAYLWALTGEDSNECSNFKVQPLESDGKTRKKVKTKVEVTLDINNEEHTFCRVLEQSWTTSRVDGDEVQGANVSSYFVDGIPKKYTEYRDLVKILLCDIENFKLMSSLTAFCNLETKTRRKKLLEIAGQMPEIITPQSYPNLFPLYSASKDIDGIKLKMNFEKKRLEQDQSSIPDKISENERNYPKDIDFNALKKRQKEIEKEIDKIDSVLQKSAATRSGIIAEIDSKKKEIFDKEIELTEIESQLSRQIDSKKNEVSKKIAEKKSKLDELSFKVETLKSKRTFAENMLKDLESRKAKLSEEWKEKNKETFDTAVNDTCPTCGRKFTEEELIDMRNELVKAFNSGKTAVLREIATQGSAVKEEIEAKSRTLTEIDSEIDGVAKSIKQLKDEIVSVESSLSTIPTVDFLKSQSKEYINLTQQIADMKKGINIIVPAASESEEKMVEKRSALKVELNDVVLKLGQEVLIDKVVKRREELHNEDVMLTEKIADCNAVLSEIKDYEKEMITAVENKVSSLFKFVRWKMYEKNLTNEGEKEICECIVDGVPYSTNLNTAKIVNAGIDIANAISKWLDISVPIWVDGKESVTDLLPTDSQLITLSVVEGAELQVV